MATDWVPTIPQEPDRNLAAQIRQANALEQIARMLTQINNKLKG